MSTEKPRRLRMVLSNRVFTKNSIAIDEKSIYANPFKVGTDGNLAVVLYKYSSYLNSMLRKYPNMLEPLRGKNLACTCPLDQPCHVDILLDLANGGLD